MPAAATGGVPPLNVQIRISTTGASNAVSGMRAVTGASRGMASGLGTGVIGARTLGDAMRMTASLIKYTVVGVFVNAGKQAIQMSRQFELSFSRIKGLVVVTGDSIDTMKKKVLSLAGETSRAPIELADALYYITSAGIKDATIALQVLEYSAKAAAAGLGTTNTVADAVTSTLNAYGTANISAARATDVLVATVREGKAEADTFAPALGKVLPVAAAYGASFEDISAAIAALSRGGLSAGTSAIYVRQTLSQLLKPSKQAIEVLRGVGLSAETIRDKVRDEGLFPALVMLRDRLGGIENAADFTKVFGNVRALTAVLSLVGPAADENAAIFERLNNSTGDLDYAFKTYSETLDFEFNQRAAESQQALIELGKSLRPLVSSFLKVGTVLAKAAAGFAKFKIFGIGVGGGLIKIVAGVVAVIAIVGILLKTLSAFVRLGSNVNVMLAGQQLYYDATNRSLHLLNATTAANAGVTATQTVATQGAAVATGFYANMVLFAAKSMTFLMRAMGPISIALTALSLGFMAFKWLFSMRNNNKSSLDGVTEKVGKLNELLNETAKYAKTGIMFDVNLDLKESKDKITFEVLKKELEEQSPGFIDDVKEIATNQSKEAAMAYVNALAQTKFGGNTQEFKINFIRFFADQLTFDENSLRATTYRTGNAVTDAAMEAALIAAKQIDEEGAFEKVSIFGDTKDVAKALITGSEGYDAAKAFAQSFSEGITATGGEISPLIESLRLLTGSLKDPRDQAELTSDVIRNALGELSGDFELLGEKGGNLAEVFNNPKNKLALENIVKGTFGADLNRAQVDAIIAKIQDGMKGIGNGADEAKLALDAFVKVYDEQKTKTVEVDNASKGLNETLRSVEDRFESGLSPAVQAAADSFEAANNAIDQFKRGQEALMGLARTGAEAQMGYRDALRDFADDAADAGGALFAGTKNADAAQDSLLEAMDSVLEVANNFAASGDAQAASQALGEGMAQIIAVGMQNGLKPEDIQAFFESMNFNEKMLETFVGAEDDLSNKTQDIGGKLVEGLALGINNSQPYVDAAIGRLSKDTIQKLKDALGIASPSKVVADEVGKPSATGFAMGFEKEMAGNSGKSIQKSLRVAVEKAYKDGGRKGANTFFKNFLEKKSKVEDPAGDFVKESIGRMKDIVGSLGDYIKSQLDFRKAKADLAKLINMQRGLEDRQKKAARETQFATTRFGGNGGAEVTGYEQSNIDRLQMEFEKASRSYAMGRLSYAELVDAEIALYDARQSATEINDEVLNSQNGFIDATVNLENKQLNLAAATVDVMSAYQGQQEAAANLYINHKELAQVYNDLAQATGIASGKLAVGKTDLLNLGEEVGKLGGFVSTVGDFTSTLSGQVITTKAAFDKDFFGESGVFQNIVKAGGDVNLLTKSIGADFTNLSAGLLNTDSEMYKNLASLGPTIFKAIQTAAQNQFDKSPLNLQISVNATVTSSGGGGKITDPPNLGPNNLGPGKYQSTGAGSYITDLRARGLIKGLPKFTGPRSSTSGRAVGGPVEGMTPYMVGERGPEMFVPKVSGTIVTSSALDRYTRVREKNAVSTAGNGNNIVVTVNNPVPEAAQDSITRRMKVLANSGMFG